MYIYLYHSGKVFGLFFQLIKLKGREENGNAISLWYLSKHAHYKNEVAGQMLSFVKILETALFVSVSQNILQIFFLHDLY